MRDQLSAINERYVQSNLGDVYQKQLDSVRHVMAAKIAESSDAALVSPLSTRQSLVQERLNLELQYQLAKGSIGTLEDGLRKLNLQLDGIVPHEAIVQELESAIDIAQKEFLDILNRYNQASLDANYTNQLKQLETAMPGGAEPSKKIFMVIISGIVTFIFCLLVLFLITFFDNTIKTPQDLANRTGAPVLGYLNLLTASTIDLRKVWTDPNINAETYQFRNLLQSIRFEVDNELAGNKILLINSLSNGEGKTFLATNLAYAYSIVNKKILLIDGNFHNPGITNTVKEKIYVEDYLEGTSPDFITNNTSRITVLSNRGGDGSLLELGRESVIKEKFDRLRQAFDVIIIEASSLNTLNKSKEWTRYCDKILAVFEAGKGIRDAQNKHLGYLKSINGKFIGWVLNVVYKYNGTTASIDE
jgi:succinoglycan biosynthesis transport protein ExoP